MAEPTERDVERFNDSLERMAGHRFLERFYELFVGASPEVRAKFARTDFRVQRRVLKISLYMLMLAAEGRPTGRAHLEDIARRHSRAGLDIRPELYDLWLECLVAAVREHDPRFDADVERAWRAVLAPGIEVMKSRY
jgi:hemoglobin-like flavoprotein